MKAETLTEIKNQIEVVEQSGFGEVTIKIKNGFVWRIIFSCDKLIAKEVLEDKCHKSVKC